MFLVTGASGFVGARLCDRLAALGPLVHVNRQLGFDLATEGWTERLPDVSPRVVFHLAQSRRFRDFPDGAGDMLRVNIASTLALADWARKHGARRFVFASSGSVYRPSGGAHKEDDACEAASMYCATKLAAEQVLRQYGAFFEVVILRLFTVYGPRQERMLVAELIDKVRTGAEITLAGGTGPSLTPVFVDDCVDVLVQLAQAPSSSKVRVLNVAGDQVLTVAEMVGEIGRQLGIDPVLRTTPGPAGAVCGNNSAVSALCRRFTRFPDGVRRTLEAATAARQ